MREGRIQKNHPLLQGLERQGSGGNPVQPSRNAWRALPQDQCRERNLNWDWEITRGSVWTSLRKNCIWNSPKGPHSTVVLPVALNQICTVCIIKFYPPSFQRGSIWNTPEDPILVKSCLRREFTGVAGGHHSPACLGKGVTIPTPPNLTHGRKEMLC